MDTSEYLPMFLAEGREHLQQFNLAVIRIEERPDDRATVDEIFRIAHSLKGMSATMGYGGMAALTHEMEDVFELLRQRRGGLEREAVDVLLECLDALSAAVESIDATGAERLDPAPLVARLRSLVSERAAERPGGVEPPANLAELAAGRRVVQVSATLAGDVQMPAVRAYMVLAALAELGETLACRPAPDEVEAFSGREIAAWLVSDRADAELAEAAAAVAEVADAYAVEAVAERSAEPVGRPSKGSSTVRVDAERLDQLMHVVGELVLHRTQVEALAAQAGVPGLSQAMQNLTRTSHALQAMVMRVRLIPVEAVFLRFPRLVRDLSTKLG